MGKKKGTKRRAEESSEDAIDSSQSWTENVNAFRGQRKTKPSPYQAKTYNTRQYSKMLFTPRTGLRSESKFPRQDDKGVKSFILTPPREDLEEVAQDSAPVSNVLKSEAPPGFQVTESPLNKSEMIRTDSAENEDHTRHGKAGNEDLHPIERESRVTQSFGITKICEMFNDVDSDEVASLSTNPALLTPYDYYLKEDVKPLLRSIFMSHGDIARNCTFKSVLSRSLHLERVCAVYRILEKRGPLLTSINESGKSASMAYREINYMLFEVRQIEDIGMEVGWLRKRLEQVSNALEISKGYKDIKEKKARNDEMVVSNRKELEDLQRKLDDLQAKVRLAEAEKAAIKVEGDRIDKEIAIAKSTIFLLEQPLVHGLLNSNG